MKLDNILKFHDMGIATIPLKKRDKTPEGRMLPGGKWEGYKGALPTVNDLYRWFYTDWYNYGVVAGWDNLVILDFDDLAAYAEWVGRSFHHSVTKDAMRVMTNRGVHVYFRIAEQLRNTRFPGMDLKAVGYVVGPESIHPTGAVYTIMENAFVIPQVERLSDIYLGEPARAQATQTIPPNPPPVLSALRTSGDAWTTANNPISPTDDPIREIRKRIKIQDFFPGSQKRNDRYLKAPCPFHDDKTPSFWIDTTLDICNCHACNFPKSMDVIDFYARTRGITNGAAITELWQKVAKSC